MNCSMFLQSRRQTLDLGIRELCRKTDRLPFPVSASYLSRLESGTSIDVSKVSLDVLWSLGVELQTDPLKLFALANGLDRFVEVSARDTLFSIRDVGADTLGSYLKARRHQLNLGLRELSSLIDRNPSAAFPLSPGFLSQVENNMRDQSARVSGEKLWSLGVVLGVDPLCLFVLSRGLDPRYLQAASRDRLFLVR